MQLIAQRTQVPSHSRAEIIKTVPLPIYGTTQRLPHTHFQALLLEALNSP